MNHKIRVLAQSALWSNGVEFAIFSGNHRAEPLTLKETEPSEYTEPCFRLDKTEAQELMDNLWQCGLRPTEGSGSAGSLRATEKHLKDMRVIASRFLKVDL